MKGSAESSAESSDGASAGRRRRATFPWSRPWLRAAIGSALAGILALALLGMGIVAYSFFVPLPAGLVTAPSYGTRILDRDGHLLARTMAKDGVFRVELRLSDVGPHLEQAMLAAEDKRFYSHPGVDPLAVSRAALQALVHGRLVSGASTITQQLARTGFARERSLAGKVREMALALRLERTLSKREILEAYLGRVHFGPNIVGASAASDHFFAKSLRSLDLAEAATLAGLVRGPSLYDPRRRPALAKARRDRVLRRMAEAGFINKPELDRALHTEVTVGAHPPLPGAEHWVRVVGAAHDEKVVQSSLDGGLQRLVEELVQARARSLSGKHATAAAAIVLDNESGEILAYVGSPDFLDTKSAGQNDGVRALRQPGSTLKPFIYAQAMDELGLTPASLLPDEPLHFRTPTSFYAPQNFDRHYRKSVRLRRALASSLNIPAVYVLSKLGEPYVLAKLRDLGIHSLTRSPDHYGPALALGDGEVTLHELTAAYATLARGGKTISTSFLRGAKAAPSRRVFSEPASALITEILSDDASRREAFGSHNAMDLPFPVAVKTGTSKGYRDNWTVGYTRAITVGVWVGNFDGHPTVSLTGARGAAPLFHQIFRAAETELGPRVRAPGKTRPLHDVALSRRRICSDDRPPTECPHVISEWFAQGQRATDDDSASLAQSKEPPKGTPILPRVRFPADGMVFWFDPAVGEERQRLLFRADPGSTSDDIELVLGGVPLKTADGISEWVLSRGTFELRARQRSGALGPAIHFTVR